ncbi:TolC family protein [Desulfococcus multivorans]|uniref:Outer membrane efflux protein n=1 Tax=Desulfococcus multivorans DSM 2059 TaxID=1121405 RepID=S7UF72_DESML|nr:TolC family protein [Desulfococcus multivorans]AQV01634.1 metal transporter [Desulfococcus multivorans]EPR32464.1 outer membrane efflux protein [Desulfococcus multivorans DSM 2059]SKA00627.1 Outer membrane protein TolC [Desulfococcus multivorans DSM 2059]
MKMMKGAVSIGLMAGIIGLSCFTPKLMASEVPAPSVPSGPSAGDGLRLEDQARLPDLIVYAYEQNPAIQAAREASRAVVEKYRMSTSLPDPQLMVTYFPDPIETRLGPQDWNASISQRFPFPGRLSKEGEVAAQEVLMARLDLDRTVRDVSVAIQESYHELHYIRQARSIAGKNAGLLDELRKISETAYAEDQATFLDVVKAQSQTGQLRYDMLLLEELEDTERTRLNGLLNRAPGAPIGELAPVAVRPVVYTLDDIYAMAESRQEEIRTADAQVSQAERRIELARYQNLPDFSVGLFYAGIGQPDVTMPPPDAGDDAVGIQFGVSIPLWFGKNAGRIRQATADAQRARAMKAERINQSRTQIRALYFRLRNAERLMTLYGKEMIPQALASMETAETWFREGQGSFSDFVEIQATVYNFQLSLARARADYGKALAGLERLAGLDLTRQETASAGEIKP